jgi:D-amino peptidase
MRVYVNVDIEGVAGVCHPEEGNPGNPEYERARRLMTAEANAVVAGIYDAAPDAEVMVADTHGQWRNIIPEELDERALLNRGRPKPTGMVDAVDAGWDLGMFIGVHGRSGTDRSALSHTFTGTILDVQVNGKSYGELGLNAAVAGYYGVPAVLVAGDQSVAAEARDLFGPNVLTVETKESRNHYAVISLHPNRARTLLREAAARAVRERPDVPPLKLAAPQECLVSLARPVMADLAEMVDGVERVNGRTVRFSRDTMPDSYRVIRLIAQLSMASV